MKFQAITHQKYILTSHNTKLSVMADLALIMSAIQSEPLYLLL